MFKANFTYGIDIDSWDLDKNNVICIDLGVNNFFMLVISE